MRLFKLLLLCGLVLLLNPAIILAADDELATAGQGDSKIHWAVFPIIYSTPETGFALGGDFMALHNPDPSNAQAKQDVFQGMLIFTQKKQTICNLNLKKYYQGDQYLLMANGCYIDFPSEFFGIGPGADADMEEDYTLIQKAFIGSFLFKLAPNLYLGPSLTYGRFEVEDWAAGGLLAAGDINGYDGTTVAGGGIQLLLDTRDDEFMPRHGSQLNAQFNGYSRDWGSDNDFSQFNMTYKQFCPVGQNGTFAFMSSVVLSDGTVPFEMMPCLGGDTIMRGYYSGYNRDRDYVAVQGEYRFPIKNRFSGVAFAGLGEVAPEVDQFDTDHIKAAGGFGVRFLLYPEQKLKLRLDLGLSEEGVFTYINFMEAF
jgi:Outer membrane protein